MSPSCDLVLLIDDDRNFAGDLKAMLESDFRIETAHDPEAARTTIARVQPDVILLDVDLRGDGGESGLDLLVEIRGREDAPPVIMMTGDKRIATAVKAVRLGAHDYLTKPPAVGELARVLRRVLDDAVLRRRLASLENDLASVHGEIITRDPVLRGVLDQIAKAAPTDATVLVTGESGTGKELVARRLHELGPRARGPFQAVNCAAIPDDLIESELFGHEAGAFTGATALKRGAFELAQGGTLLLDELGDAPANLQAKLLRALEESAFRRVGGATELRADVRVVAATSFDVEDLVREDRLRKELYYRLNVMRLHLPPLRERPDDILLLAHHFLAFFTARSPKTIRGFTPAAERLLLARDWPGNVRELRNTIERGVILCDGDELDASLLSAQAGISLPAVKLYDEAKTQVVRQFKVEYLSARLTETGGSVTRAAELAGLTRQSFGKMCSDAGVDPEDFRGGAG